jgi:hypothetical protein
MAPPLAVPMMFALPVTCPPSPPTARLPVNVLSVIDAEAWFQMAPPSPKLPSRPMA